MPKNPLPLIFNDNLCNNFPTTRCTWLLTWSNTSELCMWVLHFYSSVKRYATRFLICSSANTSSKCWYMMPVEKSSTT